MDSNIGCHQCGAVNTPSLNCSSCSRTFSAANLANQPPADSIKLDCDSNPPILSLSFASKEAMIWNTVTNRGSDWMHNSGAEELKANSERSFQFYLTLTLDATDKEQIDKDINAGRTDAYTFNSDLSELFSRVKTEEYRGSIFRVLTAFCARNPQVGYCQGMNSVAAWLLLFLDEESAFWMLCRIVESVLLPDFYGGGKRGNSLNGFYIEASVISAILTHYLPEVSSMSLSVNDFTEMFSIQLLIQLFVNVLQVPSTIFLWDCFASQGVFSRQSIALIRGVVAIIAANIGLIASDEHPLSIIKRLNNPALAELLPEKYREVSSYVTDLRVTRLRKQARDYRAKQWINCEKVLLRRLQNASGFTESELKAYANEFQRLVEEGREHTESIRSTSISIARCKTVMLPEHMHREIVEQSTIGISKQAFIDLMSRFNTQLVAQAELIFDRFDEDKSGYLDFRELMICLSALSKGSFEDKLRLCFDLYDLDKLGFIHCFELTLLLDAVLKSYSKEGDALVAELQTSQRKLLSLAGGPEGVVSFSEFYSAIMSDLLLFNCFNLYMTTLTPDPIVAAMTEPRKPIANLKRPSSQEDNVCFKCRSF